MLLKSDDSPDAASSLSVAKEEARVLAPLPISAQLAMRTMPLRVGATRAAIGGSVKARASGIMESIAPSVGIQEEK